MSKYVVYSKDGCPYCDKVVKLLKLTEQEYVVYKLGVNFNREQFYNEFGEGSTFPRVTCNSTLIGGCAETVKWLRENKVLT